MAKKKNSRTTTAPKASHKKFYLGLVVGIFLGYAMALLYEPRALLGWLQKENQLLKQSDIVTAPEELPKPNFEFYTLLTQDKPSQPVRVNPVTVSKKPAANPAPMASNAKDVAYFVQLASFQRKDDANVMKAKLVLQGVDAQIREVSSGNAMWYRVVIGPFDDRFKAEKVQVSIAEREHISGLVIREDT